MVADVPDLFFEPVTTGSCGLDLFTAHDASDGRYKKGKKRNERSQIAQNRRSKLEEEVTTRKSCTITYNVSHFKRSNRTTYAQVASST